jgi:putative ATP-dependent endonuclease of OLD family
MKLVRLRLCNFWSFGPDPISIDLADMTFLLGPNGAGKTAVLQALARMFSLDPAQRKVRQSDFHVPVDEDPDDPPMTREMWIEADFEFPELDREEGDNEEFAAVPDNFAHMQLLAVDGPVQVRFRLKARMDDEGDIEESLTYVTNVDANDQMLDERSVSRHERNAVQVHYLPARRNPSEHISYSTNTLLGRALRAADWRDQRQTITSLTEEISASLSGNAAIEGITSALAEQWDGVHAGEYYANPSVSFTRSRLENLLRHLTIGFSPGHEDSIVDFTRLSDGQQSLLYLSVVLAMEAVGRKVLAGELGDAFDIDKLRPAVFTMIAVEEPENSLSPHFLGRITRSLMAFGERSNAQAVVATHAPSLLRRIPPDLVRYLRLDEQRRTTVRIIDMPKDANAHKFVREGVQAFPELYFSRLVVLGEGDSEEIVLPRLLAARGVLSDSAAISVVPLGGRHVNHFWRLLNSLGIPHVTLLDLDVARHGGGWGRIRYAATQLIEYAQTSEGELSLADLDDIPGWDDEEEVLTDDDGWIAKLEQFGVFFSTPLDLDFMMLQAYPKAYNVRGEALEEPDDYVITAVLGKAHGATSQYSASERSYFGTYHTKFKLASKPTSHLRAMARMEDEEMVNAVPQVMSRLMAKIETRLADLAE